MTASTLFDLTGHKALVTGASSGLGAHFAQVLAAQGAEVVIAARRLDKLQALANEISASGGQATAVEMDVTDPQSVDAAFDEISARLGGVCDVVINNSGVALAGWLHETPENDWASIMETNLGGVWRVAKTAASAMIQAGSGGAIVNLSSITAFRPALMSGAYAVSKAAVDNLTRSMAVEVARHGIRVNALAPGYFQTPLNQDFLNGDAGQKMRKRVPMRRFGEYQELDGALLLLASGAGSYITGTTLVVDGGHVLHPL